MTELCTYHEHAAVVARCITNAPHLDATDQDRLRADYSKQCTPGRYCPPLEPAKEKP